MNNDYQNNPPPSSWPAWLERERYLFENSITAEDIALWRIRHNTIQNISDAEIRRTVVNCNMYKYLDSL